MTSAVFQAHINGNCDGGYGFIPCPVCVAEASEITEDEEESDDDE